MVYRWDELENHLTQSSTELMEKEEEYLVKLVNKNWDVLEVGCGTGRLLRKLAPHVRRIDGIEREYSQVEIAGQRTKNLPNVRVRYADGRAMPENLFDAFNLSFSVFNTLGNQGHDKFAFLNGVGRTIRPSGIIVISVYAENALNHQIEQYRQYGYAYIQVVDDYVLLQNTDGKSWTSERFSKDKLARLFQDTGFRDFDIDHLTDFSYIVNARK